MSKNELFPLGSGGAKDKDVKVIFLKYLKYWYLFVLGSVVSLSLAYTYLQYIIPQYAVSSKLLIRDAKDEPELSGGGGFVNLDLFKSAKNIDNEIELMKSKSLMERVLKELDLNTSYFVEKTFQEAEVHITNSPVKVIIHELNSRAYSKKLYIQIQSNNSFKLQGQDGEEESVHRFGRQIKKAYGVFTILASAENDLFKTGQLIRVKFHDTGRLAKYYSNKLSIVQKKKMASVLTISIIDAVPERGSEIITKLIEVYDKEAVEDKNRMASNTLDFIDERLKYLTTELTDVEKDVESYKRRNSITDVGSQKTLYLQEASQYNKELTDLGVQIDVLEFIENYLAEQGNQYQLVPSSLTIQDPTLERLILRFNELQMERERLLRTTQPDNPLVQNLSEQLSNLQLNILENLHNIKSSLAISRKNLEAKSLQFGSRIQEVPAIERELQQIGRQQGLKEALYLYLLQKREESALSLASAMPNTRIIDPAEAGDFPVNSKGKTTYLLALMMGFGIPFAGIYVAELLNTKVQERKEVEEVNSVPILGEIVHNDLTKSVAISGKAHSPVAETFRFIRANLQFATLGKLNKVILITSSMSGEGKTFISINLAVSLALTGKKVAVLDFDLRKPKLMQSLGLSNPIGITNFLISDSLAVKDILVPSPAAKGMYLIGAGPIPPNPTELMMSEKVNRLLDELKDFFDYILIDSPPIGLVADAFALGHLVDSSIYVVRYNYTLKAQLDIIEDIYRNQKLNHPMIVLNDAKKKNGYGYGYGYGYNQKNTRNKKA